MSAYVTNLTFNRTMWSVHELFDALRLFAHSEEQPIDEVCAEEFLQWLFTMYERAKQKEAAKSDPGSPGQSMGRAQR